MVGLGMTAMKSAGREGTTLCEDHNSFLQVKKNLVFDNFSITWLAGEGQGRGIYRC